MSETDLTKHCSVPVKGSDGEIVEEDVNSLKGPPSGRDITYHTSRVSRASPPFIASHDIPRGIAFASQALLGYLLMLAVMWVLFILHGYRLYGSLTSNGSIGPSKQRTSSRLW